MKLIVMAAPVLACGAAALGLMALPTERPIGSFATSLVGRNLSQRHNARLAIEKLNSAVIPPGQEFSFNHRVGTFSRDAGYRKAPVSYNGQLIDDWGGGVCQTSTTLYNAALVSGMQIIERHRHEFQPSYVLPGRDAAVAYSNIDLRFRNPYSFPVRIVAQISDDKVRVSLVASHVLPIKPEVYSKVLSTTLPWTFHIGDTKGRMRVRNSGKEGWEVAVYRVIGNRTELISEDNYPVMHRVVEGG